MQWKLGDFLKEHKVTAYRLAKEAGLTRQGVSRIVNNKVEGMDFKTATRIVETLERLTGEHVEIADLLEVSRDAQ